MGLRKDIASGTRQLIVNALLEDDGVADDDKLWESKDRFTIENDRTRSLSAEAELRRIEAVKDALDLLGRSCERKLEALKSKMRPPLRLRHPGIQILPDDVLSEIFRLVVDEHDDKSVLPPELTLSYVCARFRLLAANTASLWTHLSSHMASSAVLQYLTRSKRSALTVAICENKWSKGLKQFIKLVIPHASRWKNFKFEAEIDGAVQRGFPTKLESDLRDLQLPNLKTFKLHVIADDLLERGNLFGVFNFYRSWNMPNVHHIASSEAKLALHPFSSDAIRTFDFTWSEKDRRMRGLILVVSLPNLTELRLDFTTLWEDYAKALPQVHFESSLPNLTDLTFKTNIDFAISAVMRGLRMPSLNKLRLILTNGIDPDQYRFPMHECITAIPLRIRSSLKELDFSFPASLDLDRFFREFPALEKLSLDVPGFDPTEALHELPPLRALSVQLTGVGPPHRAFHPEYVVRGLKASGRWENFEYFEFRNDRVLTRQQAEILTEGKVKWNL